jgi:hypothetical protein
MDLRNGTSAGPVNRDLQQFADAKFENLGRAAGAGWITDSQILSYFKGDRSKNGMVAPLTGGPRRAVLHSKHGTSTSEWGLQYSQGSRISIWQGGNAGY